MVSLFLNIWTLRLSPAPTDSLIHTTLWCTKLMRPLLYSIIRVLAPMYERSCVSLTLDPAFTTRPCPPRHAPRLVLYQRRIFDRDRNVLHYHTRLFIRYAPLVRKSRNICFCLRTASLLTAANEYIVACHWRDRAANVPTSELRALLISAESTMRGSSRRSELPDRCTRLRRVSGRVQVQWLDGTSAK